MKSLFHLFAFALGTFAQDDVTKISPEDVNDLLGPNVIFLDVRLPQEIRELGTVKGYINIPVDELAKRMGELPKDKRVITACNAGGRAVRAAAMLKAKGYDVIGACGIKGAESKGLELVKPAGEEEKKP